MFKHCELSPEETVARDYTEASIELANPERKLELLARFPVGTEVLPTTIAGGLHVEGFDAQKFAASMRQILELTNKE